MGVQWNEAEPEVFVVPRIEDKLIDDMFYQEDEIGEMRHTAFMIECGLEEDPPDGPDVPPIPWKPEDLKKAADDAAAAKKKEEEEEKRKQARRAARQPRRKPPNRIHSMDMGLVELEENLPDAAKAPDPKRGIAATNSGGLFQKSNNMFQNHQPRRTTRPTRSMSHDPFSKRGDKKPNISLGLARTEKMQKTPSVRKLAATKSGSLHAMRNGLAKVSEGDDEKEQTPPPPSRDLSSPRRASKLVATKSGNLHGMRRPLQVTSVSAVKEEDSKRDSHGLGGSRALKQPVRKLSPASRSTMDDTTSSGDSFLSDFDDSTLSDGDVSIETDASDDAPQPKPSNPKEILQQIKKEKERKKRREKKKKEKRKAKKEKRQTEGVEEKKERKERKEKKTKRKFKVKKSNSNDIPPAFRAANKR